jgi:hypothetical protein
LEGEEGLEEIRLIKAGMNTGRKEKINLIAG